MAFSLGMALSLVVEDHAASRIGLVRVLELKGHDAITARTAEEAMMLVADFPFEVVISDIGLPDQSGHALMAYLRDHHPHLPGIAISCNATPEDKRASYAAGFSIHLGKPLDIDELDAAIRRLSARAAPTRPSA